MHTKEQLFDLTEKYISDNHGYSDYDLVCYGHQLALSPTPDAVEAKGRMDAEEFWQTNIAPNNANKDFVVPSWALNFAEKYAAYLAGHAEGQKATVEAKSAGVWVKASDRLPVLTTGVGNYFFCHDLRDGSNRLLRYSGGNRGLLLNEPWNYEWLDETPTSHAEGEKGAVGFAEWIRENYRKGYGPNEEADDEIKLWYHKKEGMGSFKEVTFYTTLELYNLYLTC